MFIATIDLVLHWGRTVHRMKHLQSLCVILYSPQLQEWQEVLDAPVLGDLSSLDASSGIIWRGAVHFTEFKVGRGKRETLLLLIL